MIVGDELSANRSSARPTVSILVPSYNPGSYLAVALESALSQDIPAEIIVQDACSEPETLRILESFAGSITACVERDDGQADALNRAFNKSSGEIIGWLNADDVYFPGAFEKVCDAFRNNPEVDIVYGDYTLINSVGNQLRRYYVGSWDRKKLYRYGCYVFSGAVFVRREVFERCGPFRADLHYCMDYEFFLRIAREVTALHIPVVVGALRIHPTSKSIGSGWSSLPEAYRVRVEYVDRPVDRLTAITASMKTAILIGAVPIRYSSRWSRIRPSRRF